MSEPTLASLAYDGDVEGVRLALEAGADPDELDYAIAERLCRDLGRPVPDHLADELQGMTPMQIAALRHDPEILRLLLVHGAAADFDNESVEPLAVMLAYAADEPPTPHDRQCFEVALEMGRTLAAPEYAMESPLQVAVGRGKLGVAQLLLELGADPNELTRHYRPAGLACELGRPRILTLLIGAGADPHLTDDDGMTSRDRCQRAMEHNRKRLPDLEACLAAIEAFVEDHP